MAPRLVSKALSLCFLSSEDNAAFPYMRLETCPPGIDLALAGSISRS